MFALGPIEIVGELKVDVVIVLRADGVTHTDWRRDCVGSNCNVSVSRICAGKRKFRGDCAKRWAQTAVAVADVTEMKTIDQGIGDLTSKSQNKSARPGRREVLIQDVIGITNVYDQGARVVSQFA